MPLRDLAQRLAELSTLRGDAHRFAGRVGIVRSSQARMVLYSFQEVWNAILSLLRRIKQDAQLLQRIRLYQRPRDDRARLAAGIGKLLAGRIEQLAIVRAGRTEDA